MSKGVTQSNVFQQIFAEYLLWAKHCTALGYILGCWGHTNAHDRYGPPPHGAHAQVGKKGKPVNWHTKIIASSDNAENKIKDIA